MANDEFQLLRALLNNRNKRHKAGEFLVQGVRSISQAVAAGWPMRAFLVNSATRRSDWAERLTSSVRHETTYVIAPDLMAQLAEKDEPVELIAVARTPQRTLEGLSLTDTTVVIVLDRLSSPGNLGTIIRSADAFGVGAVVIAGHAADPYDPQCVRASTGSLFAVPVIPVASVDEFTTWARNRGLAVVAADRSGEPVPAADLTLPLAVMFGNEGVGLSRAALDLADRRVAIEIGGTASSLNVASAVAIVLHEIRRR